MSSIIDELNEIGQAIAFNGNIVYLNGTYKVEHLETIIKAMKTVSVDNLNKIRVISSENMNERKQRAAHLFAPKPLLWDPEKKDDE